MHDETMTRMYVVVLWAPNARLMVGAGCLRPKGCSRIERELLGDLLAGLLTGKQVSRRAGGQAGRQGRAGQTRLASWLASWLADWLGFLAVRHCPSRPKHCLAPPGKLLEGSIAGRAVAGRLAGPGASLRTASSLASDLASSLAGCHASGGRLAGSLRSLAFWFAGSLVRWHVGSFACQELGSV
jgi:hypothetical protein